MTSAISATRFRRYVRELKALNAEILRSGGMPFAAVDLARAHLDGRASRELRAAVDVDHLRRIGAFFTGEALADAAVAKTIGASAETPFVDPSCGCGDLLLAAARTMQVRAGLNETLAEWGTRLFGTDLVPEFVETARERLMLLALLKGAQPGQRPPKLARLMPGIRVADGLCADLPVASGFVLMNPPYGQVVAPKPTDWASGLVTEAALWVDQVIDEMPPGMRVVAVLPDVLRSGSRYVRWRAKVGARAVIHDVDSVGQFDALTDVDVFLLSLERAENGSGWVETRSRAQILGDVARVSVGPVVDRRDPHDGAQIPYVTTRDLPQEGEIVPADRRRFAKRLFTPPFIVLRRTSRPTVGEPRLRPVIIRGDEPVAVENHLIVVEPAGRRSITACRRLAAVLAADATTEWLNARIRLRHLTVAAVREIPTGAGAEPDAP